MSMTKALVLTGDGINCEQETAWALTMAGAQADIVHINQLMTHPKQLQEYRILALPGGFSFGDEVSSGKILAIKLQHALGDTLKDFIEGDNLVIGICNGFQVLVKLGILPLSTFRQQVTLVHNRQNRFINRWVSLKASPANLFFEGQDPEAFMFPIRHGEGRLLLPSEQERHFEAMLKPHTVLTYCDEVNGSFGRVAGLINPRGNVLGLMPHPEACVRWTQHPAWTSLPEETQKQIPHGLRLFQNMVRAVS
jgi:phosphoribosylformylglycinamidine synthase